MEVKTLNETHKLGIDALVKVLGLVDAVRVLQIYDSGSGDYSKSAKSGLRKTRRNILLPSSLAGRRDPAHNLFRILGVLPQLRCPNGFRDESIVISIGP